MGSGTQQRGGEGGRGEPGCETRGQRVGAGAAGRGAERLERGLLGLHVWELVETRGWRGPVLPETAGRGRASSGTVRVV